MTEPTPVYALPPAGSGALVRPQPATLADVVERVLDKGVVITGDIRVDLVGVELLTIRLRLVIASVERAREMGIDWWERDPMFSSRAREPAGARQLARDGADGEAGSTGGATTSDEGEASSESGDSES